MKTPVLIVGLGNPGNNYADTRHNLGFMAADNFAARSEIKFSKKGYGALRGEGSFLSRKIIVAKPQTYMNLSGNSVLALLKKYSLKPSDILVVCDDFSLPIGKIRLRARGSSGSHNGLASIIENIGTEFWRLRVGIGTPPPYKDSADYVLERFTKAEKELIEPVILQATEAVEVFIEEGPEKAMSRFNA